MSLPWGGLRTVRDAPPSAYSPPGAGDVQRGIRGSQPLPRLDIERVLVIIIRHHQELGGQGGKHRFRAAAVVAVGVGDEQIVQPGDPLLGQGFQQSLGPARQTGVHQGGPVPAGEQKGLALAHILAKKGKPAVFRG